jgi:hypothetical protein
MKSFFRLKVMIAFLWIKQISMSLMMSLDIDYKRIESYKAGPAWVLQFSHKLLIPVHICLKDGFCDTERKTALVTGDQ